jgi:hypothetical protein
MGSFKSGFWRGFAAVAVVLLVPCLLWSRIEAARLPPKPDFPLPGRAFVAEYDGQASYIAHLLYWWGLFGFGNRIRQADIVMLGSSHMQFGLSARQLSAALSRDAGRPVDVFNAGLGCDTPLSFDAALLGRLGIRDRTVIVDTFAYDYDPYNAACFAEFASMTDSVHSAFEALAVWARFDWDWALDGFLPRLDLSRQRFTLGRYLNQPALILDWRYGDALTLFRPDRGEAFPRPLAATPLDIATAQPPGPPLASGTIPMPDAFAAVVASRGIVPIMTMIPFVTTPVFDRDRYANVAQLLRSTGAGPRVPFIALSPAGLQSFDGEHLTGVSRAAATQRLEEGMAAAGMLPAPVRK